MRPKACFAASPARLNVWLLRRMGQPCDIAYPGGLTMAQIGGFSFVVAAVGFGNRLLIRTVTGSPSR